MLSAKRGTALLILSSIILCVGLYVYAASAQGSAVYTAALTDVKTSSVAAVTVPGVITVTAPGLEWIAVTDPARLQRYSPRAALLLVNDAAQAVIRFHVRDSAAATPLQIVQQFADQLPAEGFSWMIYSDSEPNDAEAHLLIFRAGAGDDGDALVNRVSAKRLPGNSNLTVVAVGNWPGEQGWGLEQPFAAAFDSIRAPNK